MSLRVRTKPREVRERVRIDDISGTVYLRKPVIFLGRAFALDTVNLETTTADEDHGHTVVAVRIDSATLRRLEDIRATQVNDAVVLQWRLGIRCNGTHGGHVAQTHLEQPLNQSEWLDVIKGMKWEELVTFEAPLSGGRVSGALSDAAEHLRRAVDQYRKADYIDAVAESRKVLESIRKRFKLETPTRTEWNDREARENWSLAQRVEHARAAIEHLGNPAHHDGVSDDPGQPEARLATALAGLLLSYYADKT